MRFSSADRVSKVSIAASVLLVLLAMMLPICHVHPLLDKAAPDHCTICVSMHAAVPVGSHAPDMAHHPLSVERVIIASVQKQSSFAPRFAASRAPPLPAC